MANDSGGIPEMSAVTLQTPTPFKETIYDVATAHAELDNVLPPTRAAAWPTAESTDDSSQVVTPPPRVFDQEDPGPAFEAPSRVDLPAPAETPVVESEPSPPPDPESPSEVALPEPVSGGAEEVSDSPTEVETDPARQVQSASGNSLPRVMAVANQKGGVGKTTTSVNLGAALAELGFRVLVIDLDPQGNATTGLGIDARNFEISMYDVLMRDASLEDCVEPTSMKNLFVAPATIALAGAEIELVPAFSRELKLKKSIESVIDDFDYVLIDCPPSLGLITVNALAAADEVLVPIQCEYYALEGLSQLMRNVHMVASNLNPTLDISTIVLTMYDARTKLADQVANEVRLHFGPKVCRNVIPRTVRLSEAPSFGQPITAFDPASRGAIAYRELAKEVSGGAS
jgi:chromosome partitioning protein